MKIKYTEKATLEKEAIVQKYSNFKQGISSLEKVIESSPTIVPTSHVITCDSKKYELFYRSSYISVSSKIFYKNFLYLYFYKDDKNIFIHSVIHQ